MREIDITGRRFGRLTALYRDGWSNSWHAMWVCRCDCGNEVRVFKENLNFLLGLIPKKSIPDAETR